MEHIETIQAPAPRSEETWTERQYWEMKRLQDQLGAYSKSFRCKVLSALLAEAEAMPDDEAPEPPEAKPIAKPPKKKYSSDRTLEDATRAEKIVLDWLQTASFGTRLACIILDHWSIGDHGTDGLVNDLLDRWTEEIFKAATDHTPLDCPDDAMILGIAIEGQVWRDNY